MGFFLKSASMNPAVTPKAIRPLRQVQQSGHRYYKPDIGRWLSRDPIEDKAFFDQYTAHMPRKEKLILANAAMFPPYLFVQNAPIDRYDAQGLVAAPVLAAVLAAVTCLDAHFMVGMSRYPDDEEMRHCWTSCAAARTCGTALSAIAGLSFELFTEAIRDLFPGSGADWQNAMYDIANNNVGIYCAGWENTILPGLGNVTRWFRESCDCCCRRYMRP